MSEYLHFSLTSRSQGKAINNSSITVSLRVRSLILHSVFFVQWHLGTSSHLAIKVPINQYSVKPQFMARQGELYTPNPIITPYPPFSSTRNLTWMEYSMKK